MSSKGVTGTGAEVECGPVVEESLGIPRTENNALLRTKPLVHSHAQHAITVSSGTLFGQRAQLLTKTRLRETFPIPY